MRTKSEDELNKLIHERFSQLAFATNRNLLQHMRRIGQDFDMNLESAFVFGTLSHLNLSHGLHPYTPLSKSLKRTQQHLFNPVRLRDVVAVASLPRETVRRKLLQLQVEGKVLQPKEGYWCININSIDESMIELTKITIKNLLKTADELRAILESDE